MKNKKIILLFVVLVIVGGISWLMYSKNTDIVPPDSSTVASDASTTYNNTEYGFTFSLPDDWKGFSIIRRACSG